MSPIRRTPCNTAVWPPFTAPKSNVTPNTAIAAACSGEPDIQMLSSGASTAANPTTAQAILAISDDAFLAALDLRLAGARGTLALVDGAARQSWPLESRMAQSFTAPRLALVGDAAHSVHPIAGQGLNLAIRDVAALVECVADAVATGGDIGSAGVLQRYERWRRFDSSMSTAAFDGLNWLFSNDTALLRAARSAGLAAVNRVGTAKRLLVTEAAGLSGTVPKLLKPQSGRSLA